MKIFFAIFAGFAPTSGALEENFPLIAVLHMLPVTKVLLKWRTFEYFNYFFFFF